jgi:hypothetical protein
MRGARVLGSADARRPQRKVAGKVVKAAQKQFERDSEAARKTRRKARRSNLTRVFGDDATGVPEADRGPRDRAVEHVAND